MAAEIQIGQLDPVVTNAHFAAIVESSDDAIISKTLQGIITSWNESAERMFEYTAEEAVGQSILMIIPPDRQDEEARILERLRRGERIRHYETVRRAKSGHLLDVSLTISPIRDGDGTIAGASKIVRDITQRKLAQRRLDEAQKKYARDLEKRVDERTAKLQAAISELETFSYSVSHDLRAPLRAMEQYAEALLEDYGDKLDETGRRYVQRIITSGVKLDNLIRDVLTYSRVIRSNVDFHAMQIEPLIQEIVSHHEQLQSPRAEVSIERPLAPVLGNEVFLTQSLSNLLVNAAKFVLPGVTPRILVRTEPIGPKVRIWIEDNGIGIASEYHARIFAMFERLDTEKTYEGTGIGLAIVRKAVERMSGSVGVKSEPGKGSRFWIELPAAAQADAGRGSL
jgi:PAS domain S-box-containing protein